MICGAGAWLAAVVACSSPQGAHGAAPGDGEVSVSGGSSGTGAMAGAGGAGGALGSGGAGSGGLGSLEAFVDSVAGAFCHQLYSCYVADDDIIGQVAAFGTEARCTTLVRRYLPTAAGTFAAYRDAIARGDAAFDSGVAAACLAATRDTCSTSVDLSASRACEGFVRGARAAGDPCFVDVACAPGLYCDQSGDSCPGVCAPRKAQGASCERLAECALVEGKLVRCAFDDAQRASLCTAQSVASPAAAGAPCGTIAGGMAPCGDGLWCDTTATSPTCRTPIPEGAPCTDSDQACVHGALCFGSEGVRTCQRVELSAVEGAPCGYGLATPTMCDVVAGYVCEAGQCRKVGDGSEGTFCGTGDDGDLIPCAPGLYCAQGTCQPLLAADAPCDSGAQCESGSCDTTTGKCRARLCQVN